MKRSDTNLCPCCKEHYKRKWNKICWRCKQEGSPLPKLKKTFPEKYCCYNCYINSELDSYYRVCSCVKCAAVGCKYCTHKYNRYYDKTLPKTKQPKSVRNGLIINFD